MLSSNRMGYPTGISGLCRDRRRQTLLLSELLMTASTKAEPFNPSWAVGIPVRSPTVPCFPNGLASPPKAGIDVCKSLQIAGTALDDFGTAVKLV